MRAYRFSTIKVGLWLTITWCSLAATALSQDEPATTAVAAANLDLRTFPVPADAEVSQPRRLAQLIYFTDAPPTDAYSAAKDQLLKADWNELPGGYSSGDYASGTFSKHGFLVSLSASPNAGAQGAKQTNVTLTQHGNLDLEKLPRPAGLQKIYAGPVSSMFVTEASVEEAAVQCSEALTAAGWMRYSNDVQPLFLKRNAIRLSVFIVIAPAQQNKSSVTYSAELMSVELDPPPKCSQIHYADSTTALHFDSRLSIDDVIAFYREHLAKSGWQATTERPIQVDIYDEMIFRNSPLDMLTLSLDEIDGITRGTLTHRSAAEVEALDKAAEAQARQQVEAREKMQRERAANKQAIPLPKEASNIELADERIEFQLPSGKSAEPIKALRKFLVDAGWTEEVTSDAPSARVFSYKLTESRIELTCIDPGFIPAEVTLSSSNISLEKK